MVGKSAATSVYTQGESGCTLERAVGPDEAVLSLDRAAASEFVAAHERHGDSSGSLAPRVLEADDGSSSVIGLRDTARQQDCYVNGWGGADPRCLPTSDPAYVTMYFSDAACTERLAYAQPCSDPQFVLFSFWGGCGFVRSGVRAVGEPFEGTVYVSARGLACRPVESTWRDTHAAFRYGDDISTEFPVVEEIQFGTGRLRVRRVPVSGATLATDMSFFDAEIGEPCSPIELTGTSCCGPATTARVDDSLFMDPSCTEPLVVSGRGTDPCEQKQPKPQPTFALRFVTRGCTTEQSYFRIGDEWTGDVYSLGSDQTCARYTRSASTDYYRPGDLVDPATFPELTERIE